MEDFIRELTSPLNQSSSERIQQLQRSIQELQRERSGWQKGFDLLKSEDQTLRFYGALTLTIKINADWHDDGFPKDENARRSLLDGLLNTYAQLVNAPDAPFVLLKLCSTITAYFVKDDAWEFSVRQVAATLLQGQNVPSDNIIDASTFKAVLHSMNIYQLRGTLWFASTIVEDVSRLDNGTSGSALLTGRLASNSEDVWLAIKFCLDTCLTTSSIKPALNQAQMARLLEVEAVEVAKLALFTLLPWLEHVPPGSPDRQTTAESVEGLAQSCVNSVFACFSHSLLRDVVIEVLLGVAESCYQIFKHTDVGLIENITASAEAAIWVEGMQQGDFPAEAVRYVEFLIAMIKSENLSSRAYLDDKVTLANLLTLKKLMHCEGAAVIEDEVCQLVLECLIEIVEQYNEWSEAERNSDMNSFISETCLSAYSKAQLPVQELEADTQTWDIDQRARFQDFRNDVADFLASAFVTLGSPLIKVFATRAISEDIGGQWPAFETSLFCLLEFSDTMEHDAEQYDPMILAILSSPHWATATQDVKSCPSKARQTAIRFVAEQTGFLRRNLNFLIPCLDFLFRSLQVAGSGQAASRAVQTLCSSERKVLVEALPQFMSSLHDLAVLEPNVRHKVYGAVAAIVQALPTENDKIEPLNGLLNDVSRIIRRESLADTGVEIEAVSIDLLQALAAIGRGLRAPIDVVIDLESFGSIPEEAAFWTSGPGHRTQREALSLCTHALNASGLPPGGELLEAACDFVKSGYTEDDPSPFKFSAAISVDFLTSQIRNDSPNIDAVMSCASSFLASADKNMESFLFARLMDPIFSSCHALTAQYHSTGGLPPGDFPASSVEFLTRFLPKWLSSLLSLSNAQIGLASVFDMALILLNASDTLPRRSAASFFATVFELTGHDTSLPQPASTQMSTLLNMYMVTVVASTLKLIAGDCARSEIEAITEILRKLVSKQTSTTRRLLKDAMTEEAAVLSPKAYAATTLQQRLRFIAQAEALRGARKTIEVAKDFWIACRGDAFGYVT